MIDIITFVPLFTALSYLFILSYVYGQRRKESINKAFILFSLAYFTVCLLEFFIRLPIPSLYTTIFTKIAMFVFISLGFLYLNFIYAVTGKQYDKLFYFFMGTNLLTALLSLTQIHHQSINLSTMSQTLVIPTVLYVPFFILALSPPVYAVFLLSKAIIREQNRELVKQFTLLLWGILLSTGFGVIFLIALPLIFHFYTTYRFTSIGALIHILFVYRAISKYRLMLIDTEQIESVTKLIFKNASEGIIVTDRTGNVIQINAMARKLLDNPPKTKAISSLRKYFSHYEYTKNYTNKGITSIAHGIQKHLLLSQSDILSYDAVIGKVIMIRDVTDQKKIEEEIARKNRIESLGLLAGGVAHDFNNQLTGIMGCADILRTNFTHDQTHYELADMIVKSAKRSSELTNQLLAFAHRGKFLSVAVDIHTIISEVVSIIERSFKKNIVIQQHSEAQFPVIYGDPSQLHSVFINLALNSRDAMPNGGELVFRTKDVHIDERFLADHPFGLDTGDYVKIIVSDTGTGIDEEVEKRIFEPFFTNKEKGKGSGMGLAAVYGTVTNHKGAIQVESKPGQGTTMKLLFPVAHEANPHLINDLPEELQTRACRILLVDDEEVVCDTTSRILSSAGHEVHICTSGTEAVQHYSETWQDIDVIILDMVMPEMNGNDTFIAMKEICPDVKVLLCSGYSLNGETQVIIDKGAAGFIQKPFESHKLLEKVNEILVNIP